MSVIAYIIAIIFISLVIYKVFVFSIESHPDIEVRNLANEYDYALNAPEEVEIYHFFPNTYFQGCGAGAALFDVHKDTAGDLQPGGGYLGIARCGDTCIDYYNSMSGIVYALFLLDSAKLTLEVVSTIFAAGSFNQVIARGGEGTEQALRKSGKKVVLEIMEKESKNSDSFITKYFKERAIKNYAKSPISRYITKGTLKLTGYADLAGSFSRKIWKETTEEALNTLAIGKAYRKAVSKSVTETMSDFTTIPEFSASTWDPKVIAAMSLSEGNEELLERELRGSVGLTVDSLSPSKLDDLWKNTDKLDISTGIKNKPETNVLRNLNPATNSKEIADFAENLENNAKSFVGDSDWYYELTDQIQKLKADPNELTNTLDFFAKDDLYDDVLISSTKTFAEDNSKLMRNLVTLPDEKKLFSTNMISTKLTDIALNADGGKFITGVKKAVSRPNKILKKLNKFDKAVETKIRISIVGTGVGAVGRDAVVNTGTIVGDFIGLPKGDSFLGTCCFHTDYVQRLGLEIGQFSTLLLSKFAIVEAVTDLTIDVLTLQIYADEIDLCKEDISLYNFIKDDYTIQKDNYAVSSEKAATKRVGVFQDEKILYNYINSPKILSLEKRPYEVNISVW